MEEGERGCRGGSAGGGAEYYAQHGQDQAAGSNSACPFPQDPPSPLSPLSPSPPFCPPSPPTSLTFCGLQLSQRLSPTARGASSNLPTQGRMYPPRQCNFHIPPSARMLGWFYARVCLSAPVWWWFHFMPGRRSGPTFDRLLTALGKDESTFLPHRRCRRAVET